MPGPLDGVKVLDLTRILAGPFCTMILADMGAEVIKIERPEGGDTARGNGPFLAIPGGEISSYFLSVNRGKKSVTLDLTTAKGRGIFLGLAKHVDVVVENYVPGNMKRFGLDYEAVKAENPRIIYCSISGFGQTGPYAKRPALDVVVQGMGGVMSITGEPGGPPVRPGVSQADITSGLYASIGITSALYERTVTGLGQHLDISMLDCQVAIQENAFSRYFATGEVPTPLGTRHPIFTPFQAFQTADGWIVVAIVGGVGDQWPLFCAVIDRIDLLDNPNYTTGGQRTEHYVTLEPELSAAFRRKTTQEWLEALEGAAIPCGPVNTIDMVVADPQVAARGMIRDMAVPGDGTVRMIDTPIRLSRTPGAAKGFAPRLGEHTPEVLKEELGMKASEVDALKLDGIV